MKPTHKLIFILCMVLVLASIIYSCKKLHFHIWVQKTQHDAEETAVVLTQPKGAEVNRITVYDEQGFLLELDTKLPPELAYKYGNLSDEVCKPGYAAAKMASIYHKFRKVMPMFLDQNFKRLEKVNNYLPPFGFKTQEKVIEYILSATKHYRLRQELESLSCKRCIIVGNGGILFNKSLGSRIDGYDVVVRLNEAPVSGYSKDVGTKTTMRITYPEGAIQNTENYEKDSLFVFSAFKPLDFKWLRQMVFKEKVKGTEGFWKSVARRVPRDASEIRILNPYFIQEAAFQFIGLPFNNGLMGKGNIPTLGTVAITMALHNCDEVAVAGFGYNLNMPNAPLHYYEGVKMSAIKESWTHNIPKEKEFLRKLVKAKVITDLTNGI
ncbi:ST3 beta-galactoside alpha-2,3-sialyltransferase 3b isoform X1 [Anabas testudineus]|uniref:CMP-N-acetylneuraminate-beta-1,4-galactoside alpha-2,3-sialyltransferase n=1 Tax=Anabas testudineus TaxID=64144 RepID=A0A3Q1J9M5_ANATE|nr:ST3 beta-galactoside alpha-2,3-sialyltransferase 3b isoform X1 [Anabas testudineus]XP_026230817.1 ST3 beta-galactoside alpha-2,3-sialyltransferase 3b isoform X1 [Anabas testudineus]XP_026230818.1 ST3 beta-galactoside alpha-2,3-sialyltransferase 3b isoform X1 [Anabas testudineus]